MTKSAEGYTNRVVYFLCISDFYLFVSHLIEGANASKFIHTSANLGMLHQGVHFRQADLWLWKSPCASGNSVAGNTDNEALITLHKVSLVPQFNHMHS